MNMLKRGEKTKLDEINSQLFNDNLSSVSIHFCRHLRHIILVNIIRCGRPERTWFVVACRLDQSNTISLKKSIKISYFNKN